MLALVTDLIFSTKISSTAKTLGASVKVVRTVQALDDALAAGDEEAVLIDLNADGVDVLEAIDHCHRARLRPRIIAYASHVQAELIQAARKAGADEVMARSAFVARLPVILAEGDQS